MCCGYSSIQIFRIRVEWLALLLEVEESILVICDGDILILHEVEKTADVAPQSRLLIILGEAGRFLLSSCLCLGRRLRSLRLSAWRLLLLSAWSLLLLGIGLLSSLLLGLLGGGLRLFGWILWLLRLVLALGSALVLLLVSGLRFRRASVLITLWSALLGLLSCRRWSRLRLIVSSLRSLRGW